MEQGFMDPKIFRERKFLSSWHGPESAFRKVRGGIEASWIPDGLREFYDMSASWNVPLEGVRRVFLPHEISREEGMCMFMMDPGGWAWAFDEELPGAVFEAKDDGPWRRLSLGWEEFFGFHAFTEAVEAAPIVCWSSGLSAGDLEPFLSMFRQVQFGGSRWPTGDWRFLAIEEMIGHVGAAPYSDGSFTMKIGVNSDATFDRLKATSNIEWMFRRR
ncbi:hypothetical protein ACFC6L_29690 [Kitasatospora phosalacinea]|uniref:hypothetical protein n=1 Tax=Kitasatospora phosalacinea TaxID=2065 RepID=UPI0035DFB907